MSDHLPKPRLRLVYRLEARLSEPLELGETALGRRRIVPQTAGTFARSGDLRTLVAGRER